jgi:arylsulfatase A-like enzyme
MGVLDNTVIIYTSDNGRFHGSHGLYDKAILYDESVKAPFIVFDGRVPKEERGRRESALISSVDVAPTIVSYAGLKIPDSMQGRDLIPVIQQTQDPKQWRDSVYTESLFIGSLHQKKVPANIAEINEQVIAENKSYRSRGVRTERYKYFCYYEHSPVIEELYDMEADPYEQNNLVANPEYIEVLNKLRKETQERHAVISSQERHSL